MIDLDLAVFIPIVAISATAWVLVTLIGARSRKGAGPDAEENARLVQENEDLKRMIGRMERRLGVLEQITTDPSQRTAREIEQLR